MYNSATMIPDMFALANVSTLTTNYNTLIGGFVACALIGTAFVYVVSALRKGRGAAR